ncbi:MAG: hypothetical protein IJO11_08010 [Alphaproteobacteria bacterium]|nr:hypothetical protein [Alphaproteobacteria bacterium]
MPDSVWHLGEMWQERCAIIVTRPRVGARDDIFLYRHRPSKKRVIYFTNH